MTEVVIMEELQIFNAEEIQSQQSKTITKSKDLIQKARHSLSAKELTLVDFMVSKLEETDKDLFFVDTTIAEINEVCNFGQGGAAHSSTEKALLNLANKGFWMLLEDGTKTIGRWLEKPYIKAGQTRLKLDSDMAPYLLNLVDGKKSRFFFKDIINLKSIYAKKLYESLRSYQEEEITMSVNEIKILFNKEDLEWYRVLAYLRKAKNDINNFTTIEVSYLTVKEGRETVAIQFKIKQKDQVLLDAQGNVLNK
ncbi:RepB family plasmid replication initiator protein [Listeria monocytogenes]|nr:RepB family plasmid replication initiator protein [Listeria monocytogenes]EAG8561607.1 RepB family plasmid replication initiator protein [Listeria monocytogenes]